MNEPLESVPLFDNKRIKRIFTLKNKLSLIQIWLIWLSSLVIFSGCKNPINNEFPHCRCLKVKISKGIQNFNKGNDSLLHQLFIISGDSCLLDFEIEVGVIDLPWQKAVKNIQFCSENDKTFSFSADSLQSILQTLISCHCEKKSTTCSTLFSRNVFNQSKGLTRDVLFLRASLCFYTPKFPSYQYAEYNYCYENNFDYSLKMDSLQIMAAEEYLKSYKKFKAMYAKDRGAHNAEYIEWEHDYFHRLWQKSFDWYKVNE